MAVERALHHGRELRGHDASADALQQPEPEQHSDRGSEGAADDAGEERGVADQQQPPRAEQVPDAPGEDQHEGETEGVEGGVPLDGGTGRVEVGPDGGQGHGGRPTDDAAGGLGTQHQHEGPVAQRSARFVARRGAGLSRSPCGGLRPSPCAHGVATLRAARGGLDQASVISTGTPFTAALPEGTSSADGGISTLVFAPGRWEATVVRVPGAPVAEAVGKAHHTAHELVGDLDHGLDRARLGGDRDPGAVGEVPVGGVVGMDQERGTVTAAHQRREVVQPRVVRADVASADQHELGIRLRHAALQAVEVAEDVVVGQLDVARGGAQHVVEVGATTDRGRGRAGGA